MGKYDLASGPFTQQDPIGLAGGLNLYGYAGGDPVNFEDPFGLCKDEKGKERECRVTWDNPNATRPDSPTMAAAQALAIAADVDLGLTSGRRAAGSDCSDSRHDCGLAFDIGTINGTLVGSGNEANQGALPLVLKVQVAAFGIANIRENFGPGGLFKRGAVGAQVTWTPIGLMTARQRRLWDGANNHQDHVHISIQTP